MPQGHWSDCSLHNGPCRRPTWCDCGGYEAKHTYIGLFKAWLRMNWLYFTRQL